MPRNLIVTLALLGLGSASPVSAQFAADSLTTPESPPPARAFEMARPAAGTSTTSPEPQRPDLIDWRGEETIRDERDRMQRYVDLAEAEAAAARARSIRTKATVDVKKAEISALDQRIKAAKQAKLDAERKSLEAEKKRQELMRDFFDRMLEVESARGDLSTAQIDYGRSLLRSCDLELQLLGTRALGLQADDNAMLKSEQQFLDVWKVTASAREKVAEREQSLADRKLRVYKAWANYLGGR